MVEGVEVKPWSSLVEGDEGSFVKQIIAFNLTCPMLN